MESLFRKRKPFKSLIWSRVMNEKWTGRKRKAIVIFDGKRIFSFFAFFLPLLPLSLAETLVLAVSFISKASFNCAYRLPQRREQGSPFLSIPSTPYHIPPFSYARSVTRSASYHWTTASLFHRYRRHRCFFLFPRCTSFCLGTRCIVPRWSALRSQLQRRSCTTCRRERRSTPCKLASPAYFSRLHSRRFFFGIVGRVGPTVPLKRVRDEI